MEKLCVASNEDRNFVLCGDLSIALSPKLDSRRKYGVPDGLPNVTLNGFGRSSFLASLTASIIAKLPALIVCGMPKILCAEGWPRLSSDPSSISSNLSRSCRLVAVLEGLKDYSHINDAV
jgi:hypothetical protein